ncbi:Protein of unknown function [Raineyella antarctica]|uniref:DUF3071 domain-containing protein n=1 Tax=Raineyella antarctica TaxID=1577474 RepID=A0A1G6GQ36_9ACTN|nr:septation protein SepH [Raineyella antarctica]SDB84068.1 Protein of unknown function [Raineyella antarctica]
MDSSLTLREIQDRLRSGSSVEEVAVEAGVEAQELAIYAAPIMAEREYIAGRARDSNVRRSGDSPAHRDLDAVVTEEMRARGIDPTSVVWDAARVERRRWQVLAVVTEDGTTRRAVFNYDVDGRFSVAANEDARWMLGELPLPPVDQEAEPTVELTEEQRRTRFEDEDEDLDDDWGDDGPSDIQTLHEMLSNYEETVTGYEDTLSMLRGYGGDRETYAGPRLVPDPDDVGPTDDDSSDHDPPDDEPPERRAPRGDRSRPTVPAPSSRRPRPPEPPPASADRPAPRAPSSRRPGADSGDSSPVEGEQPPPPPRRRTPRKRAQVPSWDEIVFGSGNDDHKD